MSVLASLEGCGDAAGSGVALALAVALAVGVDADVSDPCENHGTPVQQ